MAFDLVLPVVLIAVTVFLFVRAWRVRHALELRRRLLELLGVACRRGVPLGPLLAAVEREGRRTDAVSRVRKAIEGGATLAYALAHAGTRWCEPHMVEAVRAAEGTANTGDTLLALAAEDERTLEVRHRLHIAFLYPVVLALLAIGLSGFLTRLPFNKWWWYPDIPDVGLTTFAGMWLGIGTVTAVFAHRMLRGLRIRPFGRALDSARLLRLTGVLVNAGLSVPAALRRAAAASRSRRLGARAAAVAQRLESGERSDEAWAPLRLPTALTLRLGAMRTTNIEGTLKQLARRLVEAHRRRQERWTRWMQPASIAAIALLVCVEYAVLMRAIVRVQEEVGLW